MVLRKYDCYMQNSVIAALAIFELAAPCNGIALKALESSRVTITGGEVSCQQPKMPLGFGNAVVADSSSKVTIMGGKIIGGKNGDALDAELQGIILVNGGTITGQYGPALAAEGNGMIFLAGGMVTMKHAEVGIMAGGASGTINLLSRSKPFSVNGVAMNHTELAPNSSGMMSGILADGQRLNMGFLNRGYIFLNVNKPATLRSISIPVTETR